MATLPRSLAQRIIDGLHEAIRAATCRHQWTEKKHPQQVWIACEKCGIRAYIGEPE